METLRELKYDPYTRGMRAKRDRSQISQQNVCWTDILYEFIKFSVHVFNFDVMMPHFMKLFELCKDDIANHWYLVDFDIGSDCYEGDEYPKIDFKSKRPNTINLLHFVVMKSLAFLVPVLMTVIDPNIPSKEGRSIWYFVFNARMSDVNRNFIIEHLLKKTDPNATCNEDVSPLYRAICNRYENSVIKMFIDAGADVNFIEKKYGMNSLYYGNEDNYELVEMLLKAGADPNWSVEKEREPFPVLFSVQPSNISILMIQHGADYTVLGGGGDSFLNYSMKMDDTSDLVDTMFRDIAVKNKWIEEH